MTAAQRWETVDSNAARFTAAVVACAAAFTALTGMWPVAALLAADFASRAAFGPKMGVLGRLGVVLRGAAGVAAAPGAGAPKRFAAVCGAMVAGGGAAAAMAGFGVASVAMLAVLAVLATLEASIGFCAGCAMYRAAQRVGLVTDDCVSCADGRCELEPVEPQRTATVEVR